MRKAMLTQRRKMLAYYKQVIDKVSFSAYLFEKEMRKAVRAILPDDLDELRDWAFEKYESLYRSILERIFGSMLPKMNFITSSPQ
jgi:hypothetical protein